MKQFDFIKDPEKGGDDSVSLEHTPKRKLDLGPRLVCLVIAVFIWIYMVNLNDTDVTSTLTLKIDVVGTEALRSDDNMLIYGMDKNTVTITVKGSNRDLKKYTEVDYRATVDVSGIGKAGKHTLPVDIKTPSGSSITLVNSESPSVTLYSDINMTKSVAFEVAEGTVIKAPAYTYGIEKSSDFVEISGPQSIIEIIETAMYRIEGEFYSSKSFSGFSLLFADKNGDYVVSDYGVISYSTNDLTVKVNVTSQRSVPIVVEVLGIGKDLKVSSDVNMVTLVGDPTLLAQLSEYKITLSEAYVGRGAQVTLSGDDLPDGVTVLNEGTVVYLSFSEDNQAD